MKNLIKISVIATIALLSFACDNDDDKIISQPNETVQLTTTDIKLELSESQASDSISISWNESDYGINTTVNYTIEIALPGTDFSNPIFITKTTGTEYKWNLGELNSQMLRAGLSWDVEGVVELRIKSSLGSADADQLISDTITLTATPYFVLIVLPNKLWLPGGYANASGYGNDWSPGDPETPTIAAPKIGDTNYEGYVYFANDDSQFKLIEGPEWNVFTDYGFQSTEGILFDGDGENNLPVAKAGFYKVEADTKDLTYSLTKTDWAVTGSATPLGLAPEQSGPDQDHDMVYDKDTKIWSVTLDLSVGEIIFRANDAWDISFGGVGGFLNTEENNAIPIGVAGNYTINVDFSNPRRYTYTIVKN